MAKDFISNERKIKSVLFPEKLRKTVFENISITKDKHYIIGTNNGYIDFNLDTYSQVTPDIIIEKVEASEINNNTVALNLFNRAELDYNYNNVKISFNTRNYDKFQIIKYEYYLEGY